jgi:hypothetical protein
MTATTQELIVKRHGVGRNGPSTFCVRHEIIYHARETVMRNVMSQLTVQAALFCALLAAVPTCCAQEPVVSPNSARGSHLTVDVKRVLSYGTDLNPLFEITLTYSFDNRKTIWIRGLGTVPATAELSYFLAAKELEFREGPKGTHLVTVPLTPTFFPAASGPQFPGISDFHNPGPKRTSNKSLDDVTTAILAALKDFANIPPKSCPIPFEDNCLLTAWVTVSTVPKPLEGQVAVMITFIPLESATKAGAKTRITVALEERESLIGSGLWHEASDPVRNAAKDKLARLSDELDKLVRK